MRVQLDSLLGEYEIEMPGNGISVTGIDKIQQYLRSEGYNRIPDTILLPSGEPTVWSWDWKVGGKGEYVGALPKRIAKFFWQTRRDKLDPSQLSHIGNIGMRHSGRHRTYFFDIVDHVRWAQHHFSQGDSCYWSCHAKAKDMILDNGGGAIRFFENKNYKINDGFARAWLAPWEDCWIVFNGYGLDTLAIARILAVHLNHAYYRRINLRNNGTGDGMLWINSGNGSNCFGYLIGPQASVLKYGEIDLQWPEYPRWMCSICNNPMSEDHELSPSGADICEDCFAEFYFRCTSCNRVHSLGHEFSTPLDESLCPDCFEKFYAICDECNIIVAWDDLILNENENTSLCKDCHNHYYTVCERCGILRPNDIFESIDGSDYCEECAAEIKTTLAAAKELIAHAQ